LVATANPEDYTNRGRIITPLKDRFGAQIRTHYPMETAIEVAVVNQEADVPDAEPHVMVPEYFQEIVSEISQLARRSPHINQRSGVSVRLQAIVPSSQGKIEVEALEEGREDEVIARLVAAAVLNVFRRHVHLDQPDVVLEAFGDDHVIHTGEDLSSDQYIAVLREFPALRPPVVAIAGAEGEESPAILAAALEFLLEGLHLTKRLNKDASGPRALYRSKR
jgi:magnesium chelatase subunit I